MPVFNGRTEVKLAVPDPGTDCCLAAPGSLSFAAIASPAGLAGTNGANVTLVAGDSDHQLRGNRLEHVSVDSTLLIDQNATSKVIGNKKKTVVGSTSDTHIGNHQQVNIAPRTDIFNHTRTEIHAQPENVKQPTERNESTTSESSEKEKIFEFKSVSVELVLTSLEMNPLLSCEMKNRSVGVTFVDFDAKFFEHETGAFTDNVKALKADIKGGKVKAALTHAKAIAANLNAGLAANADSPMA